MLLPFTEISRSLSRGQGQFIQISRSSKLQCHTKLEFIHGHIHGHIGITPLQLVIQIFPFCKNVMSQLDWRGAVWIACGHCDQPGWNLAHHGTKHSLKPECRKLLRVNRALSDARIPTVWVIFDYWSKIKKQLNNVRPLQSVFPGGGRLSDSLILLKFVVQLFGRADSDSLRHRFSSFQ